MGNGQAHDSLHLETADRREGYFTSHQDFSKHFATARFRPQAFMPCYGLAETTLMVTCHARDPEPKTIQVDTKALQDHRIQSATGSFY